MTNPNLSHPTEEALERFLLRRSDEQELEVVETHILACDACVTRLEALENQIADLNLAFEALEREQTAAARNPKQSFLQKWFTIPNLSWAGASCAALAAALVIVPATLHSTRNSPATESISACAAASGADLTACRGKESALLPANRALNLTVATTDIAPGPADAQVVNATGRELWHGQTTVSNQQARISVPAIAQPGTYLLRLYAPSAGVERELLREFRFEVK